MKRITHMLLIVAILGGLFAVGELNRRLVEDRRQHGITQADPLINAPPLVVFTTVALGGFRGMIADILWMRASRLQHEGKYFELVQLADWITKLEPRFTEVWAYHAWNLTYNISVLFSDPSDRWRWVRHGITLLRDEGLRYNPDEPRLLFELGWFFQHKIGANFDDAHLYYKQAWAREMQPLFPGGRPDFEGWSLDAERMAALRSTYHLNPERIRAIEIRHGPLDWRLPQAHAIYWATRSRDVGGDADVLAADRMIYQSMADAFRRGRLFSGADGHQFIPSPHLELLSYVMAAYDAALADARMEGTVLAAYQFFLRETVLLMYLYQRMPDARRAFARLKEIDPELGAQTDIMDFIFQTYTARGLDMNQDEAFAAVESALYQSLFWRQLGDAERAVGFEQLARLVWNRYMAPRLDRPDFRERTGLPPLETIRDRARQRLLQGE
ncbi:MAG TPA: hypothetical protein PKE26_02255 [Kiritimatiellia bacterium]|nr:hypothetical protein [Kiritimatiellia bacterium]HMO97910.1 hypothetical protein [Kiritimatiellia bacterium]HMP95571.1 hypothetical protein [Kiritimatiellia bacterium]